MGKKLCKIILVYYKLYGPTVIFLILEVLGFNCSFITIFVIFLQIIVWQEEMKNTLVALQLEAGKIKELGVEIFSLLLKYYSHGL